MGLNIQEWVAILISTSALFYLIYRFRPSPSPRETVILGSKLSRGLKKSGKLK